MIEVFIDGRSFGDQGFGFSVLLIADKHVWTRGIIPTVKMTNNQLDLTAVKFALLSIKDQTEKVVIRYKNKYLSFIFAKEDGAWKKKDIDLNKGLVTEVRIWCEMFPNLEFIHDVDNQAFKDLYKKTEEMITKKEAYFIKG